jgi:hypothetical protein
VAGDKLQRDIKTWLSPPDPWKNHHLACESRHAGTAAWLVQGRAFLDWTGKESRPSSLLWLHGKRELPLALKLLYTETDRFSVLVAGAGKSVLWYVNLWISLS